MSLFDVSVRALVARINRKLAGEDCPRRMRLVSEDSRWFHELGRFYVIDLSRKWVLDRDVDIEEFARELGVMREHERLAV